MQKSCIRNGQIFKKYFKNLRASWFFAPQQLKNTPIRVFICKILFQNFAAHSNWIWRGTKPRQIYEATRKNPHASWVVFLPANRIPELGICEKIPGNRAKYISTLARWLSQKMKLVLSVKWFARQRESQTIKRHAKTHMLKGSFFCAVLEFQN